MSTFSAEESLLPYELQSVKEILYSIGFCLSFSFLDQSNGVANNSSRV